MASGHLQRTSCSRCGSLSRLYGEGNVIQGGGNSRQKKEQVTASIAESRAGNSASHFGEYAASEQALIAEGESAGKGTTGTTSAGQTGNAATKPIVNPATNTVVTDHIIVPSGKAPQTSTPNSIYEVSRADGSKSITYYDDKGRTFSREDYGQQKPHGQMGIGSDGRVVPHEHKITYNEKGYVTGQYYRELDAKGNAVGDWIKGK